MKHLAKGTAAWALCAALLFSLFCPAAAQSADSPLDRAASYVLQAVPTPTSGSTGGEWAVLGVARSTAEAPRDWYAAYLENLSRTLEENQGVLSRRKYTEYARAVLALTALGEDPGNFAGYDLLSPLLDYEQVVWQGANGASFALIALDSGGYETPDGLRRQYLQYLLDAQLPDGGWALAGGSADPDVTAMAVQALAPYCGRDDACAQAAAAALDCLATLEEAGSFRTAESYAQAIIALCAMGTAPEQSLVDGLLSYQLPDGSFRHLSGGSADLMAAEQGLCALAALARLESGRTSLYDMSDLSASPDQAAADPASCLILSTLLPALGALAAPVLPLLAAAPDEPAL